MPAVMASVFALLGGLGASGQVLLSAAWADRWPVVAAIWISAGLMVLAPIWRSKTKSVAAEVPAKAERKPELMSEYAESIKDADRIALAAHEIRSPLSAMVGAAELIEKAPFGALGDQRYKEYAGDIRESGEYALTVVNQCLDMASLQEANSELGDDVIEVENLVATAQRIVRQQALKAGVSISMGIDPETGFIRGDSIKLTQALVNLLSNAVKFSEFGGRVKIRSGQAKNGGLAITVTDSGAGMTAADAKRVLAPFVRLNDGPGAPEGTGLGLPMVAAIVARHGGEFRLESQPGEGTTAIIELPPEMVMPGKLRTDVGPKHHAYY
jgi:signal transduction histidine kinase